MTPFSMPTTNMKKWTDDELDSNLVKCFDQLGPITSTILTDAIEILILEKQRRVTAHLLVSSRRIELLTVVLAVLTAVLVWREFIH